LECIGLVAVGLFGVYGSCSSCVVGGGLVGVGLVGVGLVSVGIVSVGLLAVVLYVWVLYESLCIVKTV